jgi:hypothetical protein
MYGGASDGGTAAAEKKRQAKINAGMADIDQKFSGFDNNYFDQVGQDFLKYATPQMMSQYQRTKTQLAYSLARNGLLNSGAAVQRDQSLAEELSRQESNLSNEAQGQMNTARAKVSDAKSNITNELISSANPSLAREQASEATAGLRAPSSFAPLGNMFSDWTNMYLANTMASTPTPGTLNPFQQLATNGGGSAFTVN